jgi:hypothetical protein
MEYIAIKVIEDEHVPRDALIVYILPAVREVAKMSGQTSAIQRYWRGRIGDFPTEMPEGFDERWWEMLSRHVLDGESMGDLALEWGITKRRVQVLLEKGSAKLKGVVDAE